MAEVMVQNVAYRATVYRTGAFTESMNFMIKYFHCCITKIKISRVHVIRESIKK